MIQLNATYQRRPIRFLELVDYGDWRIKVYGIRYQGVHSQGCRAETRPDERLIALAKEKVLRELPKTIDQRHDHGIGFLIIHQGQQRNWLLLDWWFEQEILKQKLFSSPCDTPEEITPAEPELLACTWELAIHAFERQAWIETVLNNPAGPDLAAYLDRRFNGEV